LALAAVLALLAIMFLASVLFPPVGERDLAADQEPQYPLQASEGTSKELPGPLQMEDVFERVEVVKEPSFHSVDVTVYARDGAPLPGAEVLIFLTDGSRQSPSVKAKTDLKGKLHVKWLPDGPYRLEARHELYFPSDGQNFKLPTKAETMKLETHLVLGAKLSGELRYSDGAPLVHGVVRLSNQEEDLELVLTADANGDFASETLVPGLWHVEWAKNIHASAEATLRFDAAVAPGNHRRLRFTLPDTTQVGEVSAKVVEIFD
jgi:hypothetical protein